VPLTVSGTFEGPVFEATEYATPICFAEGTLIQTPKGDVCVEDLKVGDLVTTRDNGALPIRWINARSFPARGSAAPVMFEEGAIGNSAPLTVSQQHRILVESWRAELFFGDDAVLVPAVALVDGNTVRILDQYFVTYHHFMFDDHQIVFANDVPAESFHPGEVGLSGMAAQTRQELYRFFPELAADMKNYGPAVFSDVRGKEAVALLRA